MLAEAKRPMWASEGSVEMSTVEYSDRYQLADALTFIKSKLTWDAHNT